MRLRNLVFVVSLSFAATLTTPAGAQTAPGTQPPNVEDADARTLFTLGQAAFDQGRYQAALDYFQQAYDLSHRPGLLFNIGQSADRLRDDRRALEAFEGFLRDVPVAPQRSSVEARVEVLRASLAAAEARDAETRRALEEARAARAASESTAASGPVAADSAPPSRSLRTAGFVVAGAGVAALAVGGTFLALGLADKSAVEDVADGSTFASIADEYDRASIRITLGTILLGVGAAAGTTGLVLALRGGRHDDEPTALELRVVPTGVVLRGRF